MTYEELLADLSRRARLGIRPGLDPLREVLERLGHPERKFPSLHIAGTNGKGSTAAISEAILRAAGRRVGLYTSPHLSRFTERIRVDGREIDGRLLAAIADRLLPLAPDLTFFEIATALGFLAFAESGVEVAVVECGLGGRLDATTLCQPMVTAITGIALDHVDLLGTTIAAIAGEKAGILKPGVPTVVGALPGEALAVIEARARDLECAVHAFGRELRADVEGVTLRYQGPGGAVDGELALRGPHQASNAAVALAATSLCLVPPSREARLAGLREVRWPGRLERLAPDLWIDGAHNPDGARALAAALPSLGIRLPVLLLGVLGDKEVDGVLEALLPQVALVACTEPPSPRALPAAHLGAKVKVRPGAPAVTVFEDAAEALAEARRLAAALGTCVLACGSMYLIGLVRRLVTGEAGDPEPVGDPGGRAA